MTLIPELPPSDSPALVLLHPTPEEKRATWMLNGQSWRGRMDLPTYLRREECLENQACTREGGLTFWILVNTTLPPNERPILASCESLRKQALIARGDTQLKDITSHGVGSVFCNPKYRGRGYARRMITELGHKLDHWQQREGERASFTVLYSDVGKKFYSRMGWDAFPSAHLAFRPTHTADKPRARQLYARDLAELCQMDEKWLRREIERSQSADSKIRVALIPDVKTMQWHHAREEFTAKELLGKKAEIKGAYTDTDKGDRIWCIWTRTFGDDGAGNTLNILRLVIEGEEFCRTEGDDCANACERNHRKVKGVVEILRAAQLQAAEWNMKDVQIWNPTSLTILAAREVEPTSEVIRRNEESIASLRWHGADPKEGSTVQWVGNEKYGWC